jgi:hypothetical protein
LKEVDILGSLTLYQGIIETVAGKKTYNGDLTKYMANAQNTNTVNTVANAIKASKAALMNTADDPFYVPYAAIAVHVEYNLRSNFLLTKWQDFVGPMKVDKEWLDNFVWQGEISLEKSIFSLKQARESLSTSLTTNSNKYVIGPCKQNYPGEQDRNRRLNHSDFL